MTAEIKRFLIKISLLTIVLALAGFVIFYFFMQSHFRPVYIFLLLFVYLFTAATQSYLIKNISADFRRFAALHTGVNLLRLFVFVIIIVIYLIFRKDDSLFFIITTLVLYFIYSIFGTLQLSRISKKSTQTENKSGDKP